MLGPKESAVRDSVLSPDYFACIALEEAIDGELNEQG